MADENENTQPTCLGIPTQTIQVEDPSKNNALFGFGNQPLDPNQTDYQSPAIQQDIIFLRQLALENRPFDGQAASRFLLIKQSLRPDEIQKIIPASSYANLLQRDAEFAKSQPSENPSEALAQQKQQEALAKQQQEAQQILVNQQQALEEHTRNLARQNMDELENRKDLTAKQIDYFNNRQSPTIQTTTENSVNNEINRSRND